jgi:hypothetical protein
VTQAGHAALIAYPAQAAVDRPLPKSKIYEQCRANSRLKNLFVQQVEQIVWQYKLAPETINLPARPAVPEIQVFGIHLKTQSPHQDVLRAIDGAVQFPVLFELFCAGHVQVGACYKRPSEAGTNSWVLGDYHASPWLRAGSARAALPVALDLGGLYEQLLHRLMPLRVRPGESLADLSARVAQAQTKQRELEKATARLEKEIQFNRKVEINSALRQLQTELEQLS